MAKQSYIHCVICILSIALYGCNNSGKKTEAAQPAASDLVFKKIKLNKLSGEQFDLSGYKGKTVFVNFWATWCRPCIEEMPSIQRAMEIIKHENIEFLFATDETAGQIEKFKQRYNFPFHFVQTNNYQAYGIMVLPTTFIFNKEGKLVFSEMGYRKWDSKSNIDLLKSIINQK
ncbi:MAG: TlpA family protein disulfide reductase [Bacteroidetes bacterium]|nr:TlpA family protein disulfide reductase [Bacteroidota bacterium]